MTDTLYRLLTCLIDVAAFAVFVGGVWAVLTLWNRDKKE